MLARKLLEHFEQQSAVHVELDAVTAQVRKLVPNQRIEFVPWPQSTEILRGKLVQWELTLGWDDEGTIINEIYYSVQQDIDWQRVVVCKELMHVLDVEKHLTSTPQDLADLIDRIGRPVDLRMSDQETSDRIAVFQALSVLFPKAARAVFIPHYQSGTLKVKEIAHYTVVPERYVDFIMSDQWDDVQTLLTTFFDHSEAC